MQKAHQNGVGNVMQISREELIRMEPHIDKSALGGVYLPDECAVDPFLTPVTMLHEGRRAGGEVS